MATTAKDVMTARVFAWIVRAILLVAALFLLRWAETASAN